MTSKIHRVIAISALVGAVIASYSTARFPLQMHRGPSSASSSYLAPTDFATHNAYLPTFGVSSSTGYRLIAADGGVFDFGASSYLGTGGNGTVAAAGTSDGSGYWTVTSSGVVNALGTARFFGDLTTTSLARPIVGMATTPDDGGYWLVASDGGIFSYGDAAFFGSTGAIKLAQPIVAIIDFAPPPPPAPVNSSPQPPTVASGQPLIPVTSISNSRNWSGYVLANNAPYTYSAVSATFNVPSSIGCSSSGSSMMAEWVGLGGWDTTSIIQAGVNCGADSTGQVSESGWYELFPAGSVSIPLNVNFGDTVTISIANTTGNDWTISLNDATTGSKYSTTVFYDAYGSNDSAEWIVEAPTLGNYLTALAPFSPAVTFTNLSWTSTAPSGDTSSAYAINIASNGTTYDTTSVDTTNRNIVVTHS